MADADTGNPDPRMAAAGAQVPDGISVSRRRGGDESQFINADGKPLYYLETFDAGKPAADCEECMAEFKPALAPATARQQGDWSLNVRPDGTRQWAYKGRPLSTYDGDGRADDAVGDGFVVDRGLALSRWRVVTAPMAFPPGITVQDAAGATKFARVLTAAPGRTLYTHDRDTGAGHLACDAECARLWHPLPAPLAALAHGEWSIAQRDDGTRQWARNGRPLYTFSGDFKAGDMRGDGRSGIWHAVTVQQPLPYPRGITIHQSPMGWVYADAQGLTLYGYFNSRRQLAISCDAECMAEHWKPALAPADATPVGSWTLVAEADGSRQWAHHGKLVFTYAGDDGPGNVRGDKFGFTGDQGASWAPLLVLPPS
jgi:predicted lipoprotein with Yx(FWY)xxD motif